MLRADCRTANAVRITGWTRSYQDVKRKSVSDLSARNPGKDFTPAASITVSCLTVMTTLLFPWTGIQHPFCFWHFLLCVAYSQLTLLRQFQGTAKGLQP